MTGWSFVVLIQTAWLLGLLTLWFLSALQWILAPQRLETTSLRFSSGLWFCWGMLPLGCATAIGLFAFVYGILSGLGWADDHCQVHPGHPHLCLRHIMESPPGELLPWAISALTVFFAAPWLVNAARQWASVRNLHGLCEPRRSEVAGCRVSVLPWSIPLAFTAGALRPRIYWSRAATEVLNRNERRAVIMHELSHAGRRDPLKSLLLHCGRGWLPGGAQVLERWRRQTEVECDRACVAEGCDPSLIVDSIVKLHRAYPRSGPGVLQMADRTSGLRYRVESLLDPPLRTVGPWPALLLYAAAGFGLVAEASTIHHLLESLLGLLT